MFLRAGVPILLRTIAPAPSGVSMANTFLATLRDRRADEDEAVAAEVAALVCCCSVVEGILVRKKLDSIRWFKFVAIIEMRATMTKAEMLLLYLDVMKI
jgi:hypothetical protein